LKRQAGNHLSVAAHLSPQYPQTLPGGQPMRRLGLAPEGACTATGIAATRGTLLPHLFTLALVGDPRMAVCFLLRFPCRADIAAQPRFMPVRTA